MRKLFVLVIILMLFNNITYSQRDTIKLNNVNVELLGIGIAYSINYERIIPFNNEVRFAFSVGYEYIDENIYLGSGSFIYGKRHCFESGFGLTLDEDYLFKSARIGYRYQKNNFLFRACFTPIFNFKIFDKVGILPSVGLTFGYCF